MLVIPHLVSLFVESPIRPSALKQRWLFCAFLCDKDSRLETGLCFDRHMWWGWGKREAGGYYSAQKISRVSRQSDENILNANGGKLPRVKLNSGQGLQKNAQKGERRLFQYAEYPVYITPFMCCSHQNHIILNLRICLNRILWSNPFCLNANSTYWREPRNKGIKEAKKTKTHISSGLRFVILPLICPPPFFSSHSP